MPSNPKYVCVPCRTVFKQTVVCPSCGGSMQYVGPKWCPPKKNNDRAWKRVEKGEWNCDRRRVRRHNDNHYSDDAWLERPPGANKKGILRRYVSLLPTKKGPDVDMGG